MDAKSEDGKKIMIKIYNTMTHAEEIGKWNIHWHLLPEAN